MLRAAPLPLLPLLEDVHANMSGSKASMILLDASDRAAAAASATALVDKMSWIVRGELCEWDTLGSGACAEVWSRLADAWH
jgi:hypothetical protein